MTGWVWLWIWIWIIGVVVTTFAAIVWAGYVKGLGESIDEVWTETPLAGACVLGWPILLAILPFVGLYRLAKKAGERSKHEAELLADPSRAERDTLPRALSGSGQ